MKQNVATTGVTNATWLKDLADYRKQAELLIEMKEEEDKEVGQRLWEVATRKVKERTRKIIALRALRARWNTLKAGDWRKAETADGVSDGEAAPEEERPNQDDRADIDISEMGHGMSHAAAPSCWLCKRRRVMEMDLGRSR
ncbi:uncharacterized protein Z518_08025 [Rhinocladiella mackenziei CBS 650.93]|uniref:Uncharacterized protein n=1 Tax=Rhinocladiella mackenziei CBS 650.93 TaxID=1442369 RepID=A0A0D2IFP6_9EURO|nr:uncharacterized protein Z518_08025 [Rhinocladiella mackenziei CBS 650.93]KIX02086.1 hypothetical protein Z518_08025 [Rhinocladiella mackenziei CBS 650.93]